MKIFKLSSLSLILLFVIKFETKADKYCYLTFENNNTCADYYIKINDTMIQCGIDKKVKIQINENALDTIYYPWNADNKCKPYPTLIKLRELEEYVFKCSYNNFNIAPKSGKVKGEIKFAKKNIEDTLVVKGFDKSLVCTLSNDIYSEYKSVLDDKFYHDIFFYKLSVVNKVGKNQRAQSLAKVNIVLLHGEKYIVVYDHSIKNIIVQLDDK